MLVLLLPVLQENSASEADSDGAGPARPAVPEEHGDSFPERALLSAPDDPADPTRQARFQEPQEESGAGSGSAHLPEEAAACEGQRVDPIGGSAADPWADPTALVLEAVRVLELQEKVHLERQVQRPLQEKLIHDSTEPLPVPEETRNPDRNLI
ncbi:hypothetical protein CCH79_00019827 [Gambusia affinis]|uniref:Uncharacterized protein n=1 Tax=Gambusia affinis TaxID=33528 RepID=A0A315VYW7_GAMAF|nr:hypothetical protein CCH79_00019827 [Gambusia affinis]